MRSKVYIICINNKITHAHLLLCGLCGHRKLSLTAGLSELSPDEHYNFLTFIKRKYFQTENMGMPVWRKHSITPM